MKSISPLLVCASIFVATTVLALADSVTLKSGEVYNGKILSETDAQITMDVQVTAGISDQKVIEKKDVQSVSKTAADEIAFNAVKGVKPGANSLPLAAYDSLIKPWENFLKQYPQSARAKEAQAALDALKEEQARVKAGDMKWNNRWYTAKEAEKNKNQIAAQKEFEAMKDQAARRDYTGALNTFAALEKSYPGSVLYPDAAELAQNIVKLLPAEMDRLKAAVEAQEAQFNNGIQLLREPEKSQTISAHNGQIANAEATFAAAEKNKDIKWKPLLPLASKSMAAVKATLNTEGPKIQKLSVENMHKSIAATTAAEEEIKAKNFAAAEAKLKDAKTLWAPNERIAALNAELIVAKAAASGVTPITNPDGTVTVPSPTPKPTPKKKGFFGF